MARRSNNSRRNASTPGWVWMMFGLGLGLLVAIGVYLRSPPTPTATAAAARSTTEPAPKPPAAAPRSSTPAPATQEPSENRFDFYEILPQFEVDVTATSNERGGGAARPRAPQPIAEPGRYLLQAGSFSAAADADRRQASLALLGIESQVQRVTIDSNVFHRVRIGPTTDLDALNRTRRQLRDAGIEAVVMKAPE